MFMILIHTIFTLFLTPSLSLSISRSVFSHLFSFFGHFSCSHLVLLPLNCPRSIFIPCPLSIFLRSYRSLFLSPSFTFASEKLREISFFPFFSLARFTRNRSRYFRRNSNYACAKVISHNL